MNNTILTNNNAVILIIVLALQSMTATAQHKADGVGLPAPGDPSVRFEIGETDFLLNGQRLVIRCGEMHFSRIPHEYWRHRLQMAKAMGLNTVAAYLFWNFHELREGTFDWSGMRDTAEFCRIAQEEGLWVLLRPGPYSCAEWEAGGLPWWLFKHDEIQIRSRDPLFLEPARRWLTEVGRVLAPLQVTRGGPILMVQVENEYGFFGRDADYMGDLRDILMDAGFDVPFFACNPVHALPLGFRPDIFQAVNFRGNPEESFRALREIQPKGPLMNAEFYPAWFDTWGNPHHRQPPGAYLKNIEWMLDHHASFSIYMAHGGTSFGFWAGADRPYKPDTTSYDYDAPISEAGWATEKFRLTRELFSRYLLPGETLPDVPEAFPVIRFPEHEAVASSSLIQAARDPVDHEQPLTFEQLDQPFGAVLYRAVIPPGPEADLSVRAAHDIGYVFLNGERVGFFDRRHRVYKVEIPAREEPAELDVLIESMGRINFGRENVDRKGLHGPVLLDGHQVGPWRMYRFPLDADMLDQLVFEQAGNSSAPVFHRFAVDLKEVGDTFLDMREWGKGMVWVNGHNLGRFWAIGPQQTLYVPGAWLKPGENEFLVLDYLGPARAVLKATDTPILDELRPLMDVTARRSDVVIAVVDANPAHKGRFPNTAVPQRVLFAGPQNGRFFQIESINSHSRFGHASIADLSLLDHEGNVIHTGGWTIASVSSEESTAESAPAAQAIDGQTANYWHSAYSGPRALRPHFLVIDLGAEQTVSGFIYVPRQDDDPEKSSRIRDYRIYVGNVLKKL